MTKYTIKELELRIYKLMSKGGSREKLVKLRKELQSRCRHKQAFVHTWWSVQPMEVCPRCGVIRRIDTTSGEWIPGNWKDPAVRQHENAPERVSGENE